MATFADAVGEEISPGRNAATWRIKEMRPLIPSSVSRSSAGALMISVFSVIIA